MKKRLRVALVDIMANVCLVNSQQRIELNASC